MIQGGRPRGRLPLHPRPLPHEALSSWVDRLAACYRLHRWKFLRLALGADPAPSGGELDAADLPSLADALAERTGVPLGRIRGMTLAGYVPDLITATEPRPGLFNAYACQFGWFMSARRRNAPRPEPSGPWLPWRAMDLMSPTPRCCPRCLLTDTIPYVRLHWRLAWMASCPRHGEVLVPVVMPLTHPLLTHFLGDYEPERAAPDLLALDRITFDAATTGTALLPGDADPVMGRAWLRALRTLIDELVRPMDWFGNEGRGELAKAWLCAGRMLNARHGFQGDTFESLPAEQRGMLLQVAGAVVRHQAIRPARHGPGTMLRVYATQWNSDQLCET